MVPRIGEKPRRTNTLGLESEETSLRGVAVYHAVVWQ